MLCSTESKRYYVEFRRVPLLHFSHLNVNMFAGVGFLRRCAPSTFLH